MSDINSKISKGLLGTKLGMTQVWDAENRLVPVTVIQVSTNVVTEIMTVEKNGYEAVQIAAGAIDPRKVNKPAAGKFAAAGVTPRRTSSGVPIRKPLRSFGTSAIGRPMPQAKNPALRRVFEAAWPPPKPAASIANWWLWVLPLPAAKIGRPRAASSFASACARSTIACA